jgi:DNA-binding NarL/FixJ family response regulator
MENASAAGGATTAGRVRIVIIESHRLVADEIRRVALRAFPQAEVTVCHTGGEALRIHAQQPAQLALVGLSLPDLDGLDVLLAMAGGQNGTRRLVVSERRDERTREFLREMGIDGHFDPLDEGSGELKDAMRRVMEGGTYFSAVRDEVEPREKRAPLKYLTPARYGVFALIGGGCDEQRASEWLGISKDTVHTHLQHVMRALGLQSRHEVMREALRRGVVRVAPCGRTLYPGYEHILAERARKAGAPLHILANGALAAFLQASVASREN